MNRKIGLILIAVIILVGLFVVLRKPSVTTDYSQAADAQVRQTVKNFGEHLQNVSLLAPKDSLPGLFDKEYGAYVSADLLAAWKKDPSLAPGRTTSSPFPGRIDVTSVEKINNTTYVAQGSIIEITNYDEKPMGSTPVTMTLSQINDAWLITAFTISSSPEKPVESKTTTISGTYGCLPHRDTSGPVTMECAFGLHSGALWYALDMSAIKNADMSTQKTVTLTGILVPENALSTNQWKKYAIAGIMKVSNVKVSTATVSVQSLEVVEDSRCPVDVQCIWAGTVKVKVRVTTASGATAEDVVTLNEMKMIAGVSVTLTEVKPAKTSKPLTFSDYSFTFLTK